MPKRRPENPKPFPVLIIGGLLVLALVGFSLSRTMRREPPPPVPSSSPTASLPTDAAPAPAPAGTSSTAPQNALPPLTSPRAGSVTPAITPPIHDEELHGAELAGIARSKPEEALALFEAKNVTFIDVRDIDSYRNRHIPGSLHIPLSYIDGEVPYLPRDKPIVAYCT